MSVIEDFLKKMKMGSDDDYDDDYDDYDEYEDEEDDDEEDDEILNPRKAPKRSLFKPRTKAREEDEYDDEDDLPDDIDDMDDDYTPPVKKETKSSYSPSSKVVGMNAAPQKKASASNAEVCMIVPKSFDDANTIADVLLSHKAVVLNLEGIDMAAAQRIIDFASGSCYTVGGTLQKISKKIFIVVPSDMNLSGDFDQLLGDMIDLNSVNTLR